MTSRAPERIGIETPRERIAAGTGALFRYAVMGFVIAISVLPLVWVVISSLETNSEILSSALNLPANPSLKGYATAFRFARLDLKFVTSLIVAASTTTISLLIYSLAAYALSRFRFRLRTVVFTLLISSILIPVNTMVQPVYEMVLRLGLYDTKAALILVYTGFSMPLCLFVLRSYMMHLPYEMEESAYLEGASVPRTFWQIMLPLTQPALVSSAVLTFLGSWNELLYALLLTSSEHNRTLPLAMRYFMQQFTFDFSAMFAALVIYVVPSIILYVVLQEQIMSGIATGAINE